MTLTQAQKAAAAHRNGHALVLAGPGTGKTKTLIERCRILLRHGVPLDAMFVTTFTKKAALEIRDRLKAAVTPKNGLNVVDRDEVLKNAHIDTFHSLCARLLKRFPRDVGLPYDFKIISDDDQRQILYELGIEWDEEEGNYIDYISRWKDSSVGPLKALDEAKEIGDKFSLGAAQAFQKYEDYRSKNYFVDFSDLITLATEILKAGGEGARWFHGNFSHFIVDEFQDTNHTQIEFLKAALGRYGMLWAVGDEDQSLYEWRGSSPFYCLNFQSIFKPAKLYHLNESFRCSPQIIKMSGKLISRNRGRYDKSIVPARKPAQGEAVIYKQFPDSDAEASWIAGQLKRYKSQGGSLSKVAILFRTSGVSTSVQRQLEKHMVPFRLMGTSSFWTLPEVRLFVISVASICGDRRFDVRNGFGKTQVGFKCRSFSEELKGEPLRAFANPLSRVLYEFRPRNLDAERKGSWMTSVEAVLNILVELDDTKEFLDLAYKRQNEEEALSGDRVFLSTLHSAKGLEWDMVFLAGAEDDLLPHFKSSNIEEERRLFYVGMTRAKHQLLVSYAGKRHEKSRAPSRFLKETVLSPSENVGVFKWFDSTQFGDNGEKKPVSKAVSGRTAGGAKPGKGFRRRGGRSLIDPDEDGFS